jgi:hypothetical protein
MDSHTSGKKDTPGKIRFLAGTTGIAAGSRSRAGFKAVPGRMVPEITCTKCGSRFHHDSSEESPGQELCPECREVYVRHCKICKKPYRADTRAGSVGMCQMCYYLVYSDDED